MFEQLGHHLSCPPLRLRRQDGFDAVVGIHPNTLHILVKIEPVQSSIDCAGELGVEAGKRRFSGNAKR
jgi:hypothetical protein